MPNSGRKERERTRHRQEILAAAENVFVRKGFFNTTMSEIALAAEFGMGTIYQYFSSKEELYTTLILEKAEAIMDVLTLATRKSSDPVDKIKDMITEQMKIFEESKGFIRLMAAEFDSPTSPEETRSQLRSGVQSTYQRFLEANEKIFLEGIRLGVFRNFPPRKMAVALQGIINGFVNEWVRSGFQESLSGNTDFIIKIFLDSVEIPPDQKKK
ncbi:MAG: TetR/AcrR family transcriptional regulator [bacterium]|nr:TetR/AcrR family transcriptional regulator [bacterium]